MKRNDLLKVLQAIYSQGQTSRAALAETLGFAPSYISALVAELRQAQLIEEGGRSPSRVGRRRVLLQVRSDLAHLLGIRIGRANTRIVVTDFSGGVLTLRTMPTEIGRGEQHVFDLIEREIGSTLHADPLIRGIGVAISGVIDRHSGTVLFWPKVPGWTDVPLKRRIQAKYSLPVVVEDTARTMALAEKRFGSAKGYREFVYVVVSMGIGAAIYIDDRLYLGADDLAGELGHTTIDERGDLCSCGNRGCLEVFASGWAIINRVKSGLSQGVHSSLASLMATRPDQMSIEAIVGAAKEGDQLAQTVLREAGLHLGTGIATVINLLNPEAIVLGGEVPPAAKAFLIKPLFHSFRARTLNRSVRNLKVIVSRMGGESGAVGASILVAEKLLPNLLDYPNGQRPNKLE
ncbi:MAG TPA: ROK family transcriptional regulator [Terriglobia bacterium]|jgi:predicted NBD/HSP70 family sugar kinase|nr:ROK family transcriptional regulator [Terriglobia bacterium]